MIYFFSLLVLLYVALATVMYVFQRQMMYIPDKNIEAPERYGLSGFRDLRTKTADGLSIQIWYRPAAEGMPTICYFHGNAAHLGNRAGKFAAFAHDGFGVLALSYRGYGKSEGMPSEEGIYADARAALQFLIRDQRIALKQIILFGESLGSGVAVQMATEHAVGAVVLEAPYTSVINRAAEIYYFVPVRLLIKDHFDSLAKIVGVKAPVLIFHGELDLTIPPAHGRTLLAAANEPKHALFFPHIGHTDFDSGLISEHVLDFASQHHLLTK